MEGRNIKGTVSKGKSFGVIEGLEELLNSGTTKVRRYWTPEEEATVLRYYGKLPVKDIAKALGRSTASIHMKYYALKERVEEED